MGQDSDTQQLSQDIAHTRADLTRDLDALTDKVSPSRVVERRVERTRSGMSRMKESVMGSASDTTSSVGDTTGAAVQGAKQRTRGNPLAAGLLAFGAGWLVSSLLPATEQEAQAAQKLEDAAKEHGQPVADHAKQAGQDVGQAMKEKASGAAQQVKETAQDSAARVKDEGTSSAERVSDEARPGSSS
jgi:gas vesicle protein